MISVARLKKNYLCYSMKDSRHPHFHKMISTWLLTVTLFLGLFGFTGYSNNTFSREKETRTTELVVSITTTAKRAAYYPRVFAQFHQSSRCDFCQSDFDLLACFHNRLFKTRIDQNSRQVSSFQKTARFFQQKTLPQSPDEDGFLSNRG